MELRDKIFGVLIGMGNAHMSVVDRILALVEDAGYVRLAANQDPPDLPAWDDVHMLNAYLQGQDEMFAAVFRKVEKEE